MPRMIQGVICPVITPFRKNGALDEPRLRRHIEFLLKAEVDGLMFTAGCGEFFALSDRERLQVTEVAVDACRGAVPVIIGLLAPGTEQVVSLARQVRKAGAHALMVLPPYYIKPSPAGTEEHFRQIAGESGLPLVLYNNPGRTGVSLDTSMLARLARLPAVVAVKDCDRDLASITEKLAVLQKDLVFLSGDDDLAFPSLRLGAGGGVWALVNLFPDLFVAMRHAIARGEIDRAQEIHLRLLPLIRALFIENHPGPLKEALKLIGRPAGNARPPLQAMTPAQKDAVIRALALLSGQRQPLPDRGKGR